MFSSPLEVCLGITSKCNLNCKHCLGTNTRQNKDLTTPELLKVIDQLGQAKVFKISLFGGEPLCHPDFFKLLAAIQKYPISFSLNTNAGLIDKPMAKRLVEHKLKSFCVSFDGSKAEIMDRMRGRGAFDGCLTGIKNLLQFPVSVMLSATVTRYNISDLRNMVLLAQSLGASGIRFNHVFYSGNAACFIEEVMVGPKEELPAIKEIYNLQKEFGDFITGSYLQQKEKLDRLKDFTPLKDKVKIPPCGAAINKCNIRPDGKVTPCELIWDLMAGDLRQQSFLDIWRNSPVLNRFRKTRTISLKGKPGCQGCRYQYLCFIGHRCYPYYYPRGLKDKSLYCWKGIELEEIFA